MVPNYMYLCDKFSELHSICDEQDLLNLLYSNEIFEARLHCHVTSPRLNAELKIPKTCFMNNLLKNLIEKLDNIKSIRISIPN